MIFSPARWRGRQTLPLSTCFLEQEMEHNIESDSSYHAGHDADRHLPGIVYDPARHIHCDAGPARIRQPFELELMSQCRFFRRISSPKSIYERNEKRRERWERYF